MVWTTAVINGDMNFADTLYWLQIATTTASNHSSHNSLFSRSAKLIFSYPHFPFIHNWSPKSKTFHVSLIISALQKNDSPSSKIRSTAPTYYIMENLFGFESMVLLWWMKSFAHMKQRCKMVGSGKQNGSVNICSTKSAGFGVICLNTHCRGKLKERDDKYIINNQYCSVKSSPLGVVTFCFQELWRFLSGEAAFGCRTAKDQFKPWIPERSPEHIQYPGYKIHISLFSINLFAYQLSYQWLSHLSISLMIAILFSNQMASTHKCIKQADASIQSMHNTTNTHKHAHPHIHPSIIYHHLSYAGGNMWFQHALSWGKLHWGQVTNSSIHTGLIYGDKHTNSHSHPHAICRLT